MHTPPPARPHWEELLRRLAEPVFLLAAFDYDGTLAPIVERPEDARCPSEVREALVTAAATPGTTVAVVSGRALADLKHRVGLSGLWYAGTHGLEVEDPRGTVELVADTAPSDAAIAELASELAAEVASIPGALLERKPHSVAYHFRRAPADRAAAFARRLNQLVAAAQARGAPIALREGKMVAEVLPAAARKSGALEAIRRRLPAGAFPWYSGDDVTDEDAFAAVAGRGLGLLVAERPRPSRAAFRVRDPEELRELITAVIAARQRGRGNPERSTSA